MFTVKRNDFVQKEDVLLMAKKLVTEKGINFSGFAAELYSHSENVAGIAVEIGLLMNLNLYDVILLAQGGYLHDFGKASIDLKIL